MPNDRRVLDYSHNHDCATRRGRRNRKPRTNRPAPKRIHINDVGFQTAMPELIFERIFSYLSPGYLHLFGRLVCKSWKRLIDTYIYNSIKSKAFLQLIMSKNTSDELELSTDGAGRLKHKIEEDRNYRVHCAVYKASACDPETNVFTFVPLKRLPAYSVTAIQSTGSGCYNDPIEWKLLDIVSSLFPTPERKSPAQHYLKLSSESKGSPFCKVVFHQKRIHRQRHLTQAEVEEFNSLPPSKETELETKPLNISDWLGSYQFANPSVEADIFVGRYHLKCRYLTKLSILDVPEPQSHWYNNWQAECTLVIDSIQVTMKDLLRWECACCARGPRCPTECLLSHPVVMDGKLRYLSGCPRLQSYDNPIYRRMFPYFPCKGREFWLSRLANSGESSVSSFVPFQVDEQWTRHKGLTLPKTRCQGCLKGIETGKFDEDPRRDRYVPVWSSSRCKRNLCGRCCEDDGCTGHGTCLVCRRKKSKTVGGWCLRECLRNIRPGEPCKKLPYIYTREYDEEKLKLSRARSSLAVTPNLPYSMVAAAQPRWISQGEGRNNTGRPLLGSGSRGML